ncbi:MAG: glycine zipper 2TM domain-containing protein [Magnetococcales bacterium]|nr:glycine zipper 2TM domain-containing protein [Magnetococcales bacterium]
MVAGPTLLSGCATKAQSGAGIGALGGGLIGGLAGPSKNKEQNALIGAAIGGLIGYGIGNEMDKADQAELNDVFESGRSNKTANWKNPDTGVNYSVTPRRAKHSNGRICRDAKIETFVDGHTEISVQKACRRPDGSWELI